MFTNNRINTKTIWRLNISLIASPQYQEQVASEIDNFFTINAGSVSNPHILWNARKASLRGLLIKLGAHEKKKRNATIDSLIRQIKALEQSHNANPTTTLDLALRKARQELSEHLQGNFYFYLKRLCLTWYSQHNKPGTLLAKQFKHQFTNFKIPNLTSATGQ